MLQRSLQRQIRAASALHAAAQRDRSAALGLHLHRATCSFSSGTASAASAVAVAEDLVRAPPGALRCQKDSSLRSLATRVLACELITVKATKKTPEERFYEVELYDTVLFPEGGGQPWDTGKIDDALVDKVYVKDGRCIHRVPLVDGVAIAFEKDQEVVATVDWDRRFDHMQQHSAQHLLSAIAETRYGFGTASWWLGEERCNVDLVHSPDSETARSGHKLISKEILLKIQEEANAAILDVLPMTPIFATPGSSEWNQIAAKFSAGEMPEVMRIVNIQGIENNPCCGVHVQSLAQLQSVRILNVESASAGATRVWFVAGNRVNREFSRMFQREQALTKLLACAPEQHADRTEKLLQTYKSGLKEIKSLQSKLASLIATDLIAQSEQQRHQEQHQEEGAIVPVVCYHSPDGDLAFLQAIVKQLGDAKEQTVFVLAASDSDTSNGAFVLAGPEMFIMQHSRDAVQAIEGKGGGGKNGVFQGKATRLRELQSLIAKLQELLLSEARA